MDAKYLKIDVINTYKNHKKVEMNINNYQHHHKTKIDNRVHPFKATSPGPCNGKTSLLRKYGKSLYNLKL